MYNGYLSSDLKVFRVIIIYYKKNEGNENRE